MKKLFLIFLVICPLLAKSSLSIGVQIMEKISFALLKKTPINILVQDEKDLKLIEGSKMFNQVFSCSNADMILTKMRNIYRVCHGNPLIFATSYRGFKLSQNAVGAFFYQKGRPNIIFKKDKLEEYKINISEKFKKYIE